MKRCIPGRVAALLLLPALLAPAWVGGAAARPGDRTLSKSERAMLAAAAAAGDQQLTLLIAARRGRAAAGADAISRLGGSIVVRDGDVDYLRAVLPGAMVEKLIGADWIEALSLDGVASIDDPEPDVAPTGQSDPSPQPAPGPNTPAVNPYLPTGDVGSPQFVQAHPTWDGRGTTIGIVDTGVDVSQPALQTASTGQAKIVDWFSGTDPRTGGDPTWVTMDRQVAGLSFSVDQVRYTAPAAATYRFGLLDERDPRLPEGLDADLNRDGNPAGSGGLFGILWETASNLVWVDTDQDRSFADEQAMTDYRIRHDVGALGTDDPATGVVEAMPFVIQTDGRHKAVNIGMDTEGHGTHVAGIAAGNNLLGGDMDGAAPGAQIVAARVCTSTRRCPFSAIIEGMTAVAKRGDVDVINMSIGGLQPVNDGADPLSLILSRLVDQFRVQIFVAAGNEGPGTNTVGHPSSASVMSVGSYVSSASWQAQYGSDRQYADNLHYYSSAGPREDGGFKPDLVAPGSAISTFRRWCHCGAIPGTYALPAGYAFQNGTSMAAPQAAGAASLLVSAAKQSGVQHQPAQLRQALRSTARFLDPARIGAFRQGAGLVQVGPAWDVLRRKPSPVDIEASVPVATAISRYLGQPNVGIGIYDREGVVQAQRYRRTYTFTRRSGGAKPIAYSLSWLGNDGTFGGPPAVALPLNTPVTVEVSVDPAAPGIHSSVLRLDDPTTPGIDHQTMNVVIVPHELTAAGGWTMSAHGAVGRTQAERLYVRIPQGTPAMSIEFSGPSGAPGTGQARFLRYDPLGMPLDSNQFDSCYVPTFDGRTGSGRHVGTCGEPWSPRTSTSAVADRPFGGVWEITVDASRQSDAAETAWSLSVSTLGATVSPDPDMITVAPGQRISRSYTVTNRFGPFTGRLVGGTLGAARRLRPSIRNEEIQRYEVDVPPGATSVHAVVGNASDVQADLDLYLFDCTSGTCTQVAASVSPTATEFLDVADPAPGRWVVAVDGYELPSGSVTYDYVDSFANPGFGAVTVADVAAPRPAGPASWTVAAEVTSGTAPPIDRVLIGTLEVRTETGQLIGHGAVVLQGMGT